MENNKIILAVEDDSLFGGQILEKLKAAGYRPHVVRSGDEGLERIKEQSPALVAVEIALPNGEGYRLIEEKNKSAAISSVPVILFSRNPEVLIDINRAASLNVRDWVKKVPADADSLVQLIVHHFQQSQVQAVGAQSPTAIMPNSDIKKSALTGRTVLWVEDDKFLADILTRKFLSVGCNIVRVKSSEEAFAFLDKQVPNVILLDILLPGMNGFDILQKMRMNPGLRSVPAVILSNTSQTSDLEKSKVLGAQKFLVKAAVSLDEIIRQVASLIK